MLAGGGSTAFFWRFWWQRSIAFYSDVSAAAPRFLGGFGGSEASHFTRQCRRQHRVFSAVSAAAKRRILLGSVGGSTAFFRQLRWQRILLGSVGCRRQHRVFSAVSAAAKHRILLCSDGGSTAFSWRFWRQRSVAFYSAVLAVGGSIPEGQHNRHSDGQHDRRSRADSDKYETNPNSYFS